jgi:hypothetical protein
MKLELVKPDYINHLVTDRLSDLLETPGTFSPEKLRKDV